MIETVREGVVLVGTAHVSATSVRTVEEAIREQRPDRVLVELDARRFEALRDPEAWQKTDIVQVLREKKQHLFLLQLYLANMQARVGKETGVSPGMDMLRAVQVAEEVGAEVVLIDRDVSITLKRGFGSLGFWERLKLFWNVWAEILTPAKGDDKADAAADVDALLETDAITAMTDEFAKFAPKVKVALIDERDAYMASHIDEQAARGGSLLAVVGAGHLPGLKRHLAGARPEREPLDELPRKRKVTVGRVLGVLVPALVLTGFGYLLYQGNYSELREALKFWIIVNGGLSALGALLAGGHILSILAAFVAAPITSVNPTLAAGWFAGLTEAKVRTPTVGDFQEIRDIETLRGFWGNGVVRIILVTALANLGSSIGTYIAGTQLASTIFGT